MLSVSRTALFSKSAWALLINEIQEESEVRDEVLVKYSLPPAQHIRCWILWKRWNTLGFWLFYFLGLPKVKAAVSLKF